MRTDILFENFEMLADAPNGVPKLRQAILQLAVQGKLVPQDSSDEPAALVLERIAKEKARLVKKGKIKRTKLLPAIDFDEMPCEVPTGWEWVRLGSIGITQTGTTPSKVDKKNFGSYIPFIKPADITANAIRYNNEGLSKIGLEKGRLIEKNSILMVCIGGSIGKVNFIERDCSCNQQINALKPYANISHKLFNYFLRSTYFQNEVTNRAPQPTLPILSKGRWELIPIPLPPEAEQKRIISKVDQLMTLCDELETKLTKSQNDCDDLLSAIINSIENGKPDRQSNKGPKSNTLHTVKTEKDPGVPEPVKETFKSSAPKKPPSKRKKFPKPQTRYEKADILRAYRKAIYGQNDIDELTLVRSVSRYLGIIRLSKPIQDELKSYIRTAISRKIIVRNGDGFSAGTPTIQHYDDDYLVKTLRCQIQSGYEYPRDYLINEVARYLGFGRISDAFSERMKTIFRVVVRRGQLYRNGSYVGKV